MSNGRRAASGLWLGLLLAFPSCGGGGAAAPEALNVGLHARDAASIGAWSEPLPVGVISVHAGLLPGGEVLLWGPGHTAPAVLDPRDGALREGPMMEMELFCSGHSFLADGRLLITGGQDHEHEFGIATTFAYDPAANTFTRLADMNAPRWYPTNTTLSDGTVLVTAGSIVPGVNNDEPQVFDPTSGTYRDLPGARYAWPWYPMMHLLPDGLVYCPGPENRTWFVETSGSGKLIPGPLRGIGSSEAGCSVLYDETKVVAIGGGDPPCADVEVIDLSGTVPTWRFTGSLSRPRRHHNAVLLPDGTVLVTGGTSLGGNDFRGAVLEPELWDPATGTWQALAPQRVARLYHSVGLLLPDGRVLTGGGGSPAAVNGGSDNHDVEIFSPPYLFRGPRPVIEAAPRNASWGGALAVRTPEPARIRHVHLIRNSSVTHSTNMDQRICRLPFTMSADGMAAQVPSSPARLPPGPYLLFLIDDAGVPSIGAPLLVGPPQSPGDAPPDPP